ncbi:MAG: metallophosphoesterase family protein [Thermoleophilia bacterium]|nr:metallophosphoesterase family protein [Thermoleophilia bacterium]
MRVAVISDIHANLQALEAVLADLEASDPDELWCLGDLVGYGPRPNECTRIVAERASVCLIGNHDLAGLDETGAAVADFNVDAAAAARWTQAALERDTREFLASLEPQAERGGVAMFHASARDPVWEYVLDYDTAAATLAAAPLVLVGHSHVALAITEQRGTVSGGLAPGGHEQSLAEGRWLLNPGSVGQPRDGDPRAAWLLLELDKRVARFHRVEYEVERTQEEIRAAGLPHALADRLAVGV